MKKFLSITLTLALTLALFAFPIPASAAVTTQSTTNVLFEDNFDAYNGYTTGGQIKPLMVAKGWEAHTTNEPHSYAKTGSYVSPIGVSETKMVTSLTDTADWSNYAVSADISFTNVFVTTEEEARVDASAVVVLNASQLDGGGYEVGLSLGGDDTKEIIIRHRGVAILASKYYDFNINGTVYNLKAEYNAGVINCYVNGALELSYNTSNDDVMLTKGSAGFRKVAAKGNSAEITFDNFKVEKTEKTVWFNEDFTYNSADEFAAMGWTSADSMFGKIQDGKLSLIADEGLSIYSVENANETLAWDDYSVESDFTLTRNESGTRQWVGLTGRVANGSGYEFAILVGSVSNGHIDARIRQVGNKNKEFVKTSNAVEYTDGATYKLKVEFIGNTINGYINGNLVCSYTDQENLFMRGAAGYSAQKGTNGDALNAVVDNFKVIGYNSYTEYFNQTFDNGISAETLTNAGYTFLSNDAANTTTVTNGAITFPTTVSAIGLFSQEFNADTYTVRADMTVNTVSGTVTTSYGLLIGGIDTAYKSCYYCEARVDKTGAITTNRIRYINSGGGAGSALGTTTVNKSIAMGERATLEVIVTYNSTEKTTTLTFNVLSGDEVASSTTYTTEPPTEADDEGVKIIGRAALYKNATACEISFDNFKAYSINSYVSPEIGEMDGDGIVTAADGKYIRNYLLGASEATSADLNGDAASDIRDLVHFKKVFEFYR